MVLFTNKTNKLKQTVFTLLLKVLTNLKTIYYQAKYLWEKYSS